MLRTCCAQLVAAQQACRIILETTHYPMIRSGATSKPTFLHVINSRRFSAQRSRNSVTVCAIQVYYYYYIIIMYFYLFVLKNHSTWLDCVNQLLR